MKPLALLRPGGVIVAMAVAATTRAADEPRVYPELETVATPRALAAGAVTADWPGFLGPRRDAHVHESPLRVTWPAGEGPPLLWTMRTGSGFACPVVQDGRLVFAHRVGDVVHVDCLEATTGRRHWRVTEPCNYAARYIRDNGPRATPTIHGDRVYVPDVTGTLRALDLATGRVVWRRDLAEELKVPPNFFGVVSSPLVVDDMLIHNVGAPGGPSVAAFDLATGATRWGAGEKWGASCASPITVEFHGKRSLFVLTGGETRPPTGGLMAIDPADGAVRFELPFRSRTYESVNGATPVAGDGQVFITAAYSTGTAAIDARPDGTFAEAWNTRRLGLEFSTPLFHDGHLYMVDGRSDRAGAIVCLDPATGEERSRTDLDWTESVLYGDAVKDISFSIGNGSIVHADGRLLCLGDNGHLLWLEATPAGARVLARSWLFKANQTWTPPVISRGLLYVCQNTPERFGGDPKPPRLLCYDLRGE